MLLAGTHCFEQQLRAGLEAATDSRGCCRCVFFFSHFLHIVWKCTTHTNKIYNNFFRRQENGLEQKWARGFAYDDSSEIQNFLLFKQTLYIDLVNGPAELS